ncbi:endonuclease III domain-containing protein, partial [bacterium]
MHSNKILDIYHKLLDIYGYQGWWPLLDIKTLSGYHPKDYSYPKNFKQKFEVICGAILTQNTSWQNVKKVIYELYEKNLLDPNKIVKMDIELLTKIIKPAGYFNQKAKKLKITADFFKNKQTYTPKREELLKVWGIGHETADSILLYAYKVPSF